MKINIWKVFCKANVINRMGQISLILTIVLLDPTFTHAVTEKTSGTTTSDPFPWIVALVIGLLTVFTNMLINRWQRKSNETSLNRQIESAQNTVKLQHQITISTENQQHWMDLLRESISEYIASLNSLHHKVRQLKSDKIKYAEEFPNLPEIMNIHHLRFKISLLLKPEGNKKQDLLQTLIDDIYKNGFEGLPDWDDKEYGMLLKKTRTQTKLILDEVWQKMKELE